MQAPPLALVLIGFLTTVVSASLGWFWRNLTARLVVPSVGEIALRHPEVCNLLKTIILPELDDHPGRKFSKC